jgi:hypothetical protein
MTKHKSKSCDTEFTKELAALCEKHNLVATGTLQVKSRDELSEPVQIVEQADTIKYGDGSHDRTGPFIQCTYEVAESNELPMEIKKSSIYIGQGDWQKQVPQGFKEGVLGRIKESVPGACIET